jgi:protein O-mannosyl-transferase
MAVVGTLYLRSVQHEFVLIDDGLHLSENPYLNPPSFANILHFWKTPYQGLYIPVTYTFWGLITRVAGNDPKVFHLVNILLHATNTALVFFLISRLCTSLPWISFLGALFFAVHPVQVESVAWISGTKDTLSGFFALLCLLSIYRSRPVAWLATVFYLLAILSKPSVLILPLLVIILNRYWKKLPWKENRLPLFWLALSLPFLYLTRISQPMQQIHFIPQIWTRVFIAGDALVFYLAKVLFPFFLVADYARKPQVVLGHVWGYVGVFFLALLVLWMRKRSPRFKTLFFLFAISLLPVWGLVPFHYQFFSTVADRYLYLSLLFPALGIAALLHSRWQKILFVPIAGILLGLTLLTNRQVMVWRNNFTLFTHLVRVNPHSLMGQNNVGSVYESMERFDEAAYHYQMALELDPQSLPALYNLGRIRGRQGRYQESIALLEKLMKIDRGVGEAHYTLGIVYRAAGDLPRSLMHLQIATQINPKLARTHYELGVTLVALDKVKEAKRALQETLEIEPQNQKARDILAKL